MIQTDYIIAFITVLVCVSIVHFSFLKIVKIFDDGNDPKINQVFRNLNKLYTVVFVLVTTFFLILMFTAGEKLPPNNFGKVGVLKQTTYGNDEPNVDRLKLKSEEIKSQSIKEQNESFENFRDFKNKTLNQGE